MNRKKKNIIILSIVLAATTLIGGIYTFGIQSSIHHKKEKKLSELRANYSSINVLNAQLKEVEKRVSIVDSIVFSGNFTIPKNLSQSQFYGFIENYSRDYSLQTFTNTEYVSEGKENGFNFYMYKVSGTGEFENVYKLIYAIEHSKELKKVQSADVSSTTSVDKKGIPHYLVKFILEVKVYFSPSDQYAAVNFVENNFRSEGLYNSFFPLIRNEIRPNLNNLPDIQEASLISLVPQGAFITDTKGNTLLLKKGDPVYLGYLTEIDYENETATFVLNKGGIIENQTLKMGKANKKSEGE